MKSKKNTGNENKNHKGLLYFLLAFVLIGAILLIDPQEKPKQEISQEKLVELIENKSILNEGTNPLKIVIHGSSPTQTIEGHYKTSEGIVEPFKSTLFLDFNGEEIKEQLKNSGLTPTIEYKSNALGAFMLSLLPLLLFVGLLYFIFASQMKTQGRGPFGFGKSKAKLMDKADNKITFKDVAGIHEAKEEVSELVEFLKDPKKFQKLGGRIPKGILMCGSPGTGKTLLAKAIAGEANVPFFSISGSDFVEMFVGVGASRVRDMFEEGKKNSPCLIFIDEIDAVGRHRGGGMGGGHDEREQTLNALLVEMDGFDTQSGIIMIAATNRPDVLDPALLRPGRFDRQINVDLPDIRGREEILRVHCKKIKLSDSVDLSQIAKGTPGYSGAELANVVNEAALLAAKKDLNAIGIKELEEARDKVRWGKERRSLSLSDQDKKITAYHEAGHAILLMDLEHTEPLHKVTIIPRGPSLGSTMWLPTEDKYNSKKKELMDHLVVVMGGRVAEELVFGDTTSGAYGDIKQATNIARNMVCKWGMSESLGMIDYSTGDENLFLARDINKPRFISEYTAKKIDEEIKKIIDESYDRAKNYLSLNRNKLDKLAMALLEFETLTNEEVKRVLYDGKSD
jgi:cell division protease FtsH